MADKLRKKQNEGISSVLEIAKMIRGEELHNRKTGRSCRPKGHRRRTRCRQAA